jgi:hypothetical protein
VIQSFRNAQFRKDLSHKQIDMDSFSLVKDYGDFFPKGHVFDIKMSDRKNLELEQSNSTFFMS